MSLWVTTSDGSCLNFDLEKFELKTDLSGSDYEQLYDLKLLKNSNLNEKYCFTTSRDGIIRKYNL